MPDHRWQLRQPARRRHPRRRRADRHGRRLRRPRPRADRRDRRRHRHLRRPARRRLAAQLHQLHARQPPTPTERYVYVCEHITPTVHAGQTIQPGQQIATFIPGGGIETGWAAAPGSPVSTQAAALSQEAQSRRRRRQPHLLRPSHGQPHPTSRRTRRRSPKAARSSAANAESGPQETVLPPPRPAHRGSALARREDAVSSLYGSRARWRRWPSCSPEGGPAARRARTLGCLCRIGPARSGTKAPPAASAA